MKKLRQLLTATIAIAMLTSMVACEQTPTSSSSSAPTSVSTTPAEDGREMVGNTYVVDGELPLVKEPTTYKVMFNGNVNDKAATQEEKDIMQIGADGTNITVMYEVLVGNYTDQLNLLLAAGSGMPDAFHGWNPADTLATNTNRLYELTDDTMQKFAPYVYEDLEAGVPGGMDALNFADGKLWALPAGVWAEQANSVQGVFFIRTDWLAAVGLDMPTTVEEYYEALLAFKTQDPNGNGQADEVGLTFTNSVVGENIWMQAGPWGIAGRNGHPENMMMMVKDGVVTPTVNTDAFKDFLLEMNKWATAGVLDVEAFTQTTAQENAKTNAGLTGSTSFWIPPEDELDIWAPIPTLTATGYEGQELHSGEAGTITANKTAFVITAECEEPEGLLSWWNYLHKDTETKRIGRDGAEGILWVENDDGSATVRIPSLDEMPDGIANTIELNYTLAWRGHGPVIFGDEAIKPEMDTGIGDSLRYDYVELYGDDRHTEFLPTRVRPADKVQQISLVRTEIETYVNGFVADSVVNGLTDEQWQDHLDRLDALQMDAWIAWYQDFVDGEF